MRLPSASKIDLAAHCAYPWSSGMRWPEEREASIEVRFGIAFHEVAAGVVAGEVNVAAIAAKHDLSPADEKRLALMGERVADALRLDAPASPARAEVGYLVNIDTGAVRQAGDRFADRGPREIYGAADLVFERQDGILVVRDWKTGHRARGRRPAETPQLRFLGLAAARDAGVDQVRVELAFVDDDAIIVEGELLDAFALDVVAGELVELGEQLQAPPVPKPGPWCERYFCPLRGEPCPATRAALANVNRELETFPLLGPFQTAEHAAYVRHRLPVLRELLDDIESGLKEWVDHYGPLPVADKPGLVWGARLQRGHERIEASPAAMAVLQAKLSPAAMELAVERSISKASLERGARHDANASGGKRGGIKKVMGPLLDELRAVKALKTGASFTRYEEFKRAEEPAAPVTIASEDPTHGEDGTADNMSPGDFGID